MFILSKIDTHLHSGMCAHRNTHMHTLLVLFGETNSSRDKWIQSSQSERERWHPLFPSWDAGHCLRRVNTPESLWESSSELTLAG